MTKNKIRVSLLVWDIAAIILILFALVAVFETVIKKLLVDSNIHVYHELVEDIKNEYSDAVGFLEKRPFMPYDDSIIAISEYVKDYSLYKMGYPDSLVLVLSDDKSFGSIVSTNTTPAEEARITADNQSVQTIKQLLSAVSENPANYLDFSFNGKDYIGVSGILPREVGQNLEKDSPNGFFPVVVLADTKDDFFWRINNIRNLFLVILCGIVVLVFVVKLLITLRITKEIHSINSTILQEHEAITRKGEIGTVLKEMSLSFTETSSLYDSYSMLKTKLREVGEIMAGIADHDLFTATLKNDTSVLDPHETQMAILFLDVRGFTAIAEKFKDTAMSMINRIWTVVESKAESEQGKINKYMGDAVLVIFPKNSGKTADSPALRAIRTGLGILGQVEMLQHELNADFGFRIGIDYGTVVYGKTGSDKNYELGVIGDPVNTASRLEALNKQFETAILITGEALQHAGFSPETETAIIPGNNRRFGFLRIDHARPKGKKEARDIYSILETGEKEFVLTGTAMQLSTKVKAEYQSLVEGVLENLAGWKNKEEAEAKKERALLARRAAQLTVLCSFTPAKIIFKKLVSEDEMRRFDSNPDKWLTEKTVAVRTPDAETLTYGTMELQK